MRAAAVASVAFLSSGGVAVTVFNSLFSVVVLSELGVSLAVLARLVLRLRVLRTLVGFRVVIIRDLRVLSLRSRLSANSVGHKFCKNLAKNLQ
jgi:hypothetical protein